MENCTKPRKCTWRRNTNRAIRPWTVPCIKSGTHSLIGSVQANSKGNGLTTLSSVTKKVLRQKLSIFSSELDLKHTFACVPLAKFCLTADGGRRWPERNSRKQSSGRCQPSPCPHPTTRQTVCNPSVGSSHGGRKFQRTSLCNSRTDR